VAAAAVQTLIVNIVNFNVVLDNVPFAKIAKLSLSTLVHLRTCFFYCIFWVPEGTVILNNMKISASRCVEKVHFIDWEYSGHNYEAYDIAVHFSEYTGTILI
jgi:thiamine kinase-like enzyme